MKVNFLLITIFLQINISAQRPSIKWTEQDKEKSLPAYSLEKSNGDIIHIYLKGFKPGKEDIWVKVYDSKNRLIKEVEKKEFKNEDWKKRKLVIQAAKVINDKICLLVLEKDKKSTYLYKTSLTNDYKTSNDLNLLAELPSKVSGDKYGVLDLIADIFTLGMASASRGALNQYNSNYLDKVYSSDNSKTFLMKTIKVKKESTLFGVCLDEKWNKIYDINKKVENGDKDASNLTNFILAKNGDVYCNLTQYFKKGTNSNKYESGILKISNNGKSIKYHNKTEPKNNFYLQSFSQFNQNESKIFTTYQISNDEKKKSRFNGYAMSELDINTMKSKTTEVEFGEELMEKAYKTKQAKRKDIAEKGMFDNWYTLGFHVLSDESKIQILQENTVIVTTTNNGKTTTTRTKYIFDDIMVVKYSPDNKVEWSKVFYKSTFQMESKSLITPYSFIYNNNVYLIYNDHSANVAIQGISGSASRDKVSTKGGSAKYDGVLKIISPDGKIDGMTLVSGKNSDEILIPIYTEKASDIKYVLSASKGKKQRLGTLLLDKNAIPAILPSNNNIETANPVSASENPTSDLSSSKSPNSTQATNSSQKTSQIKEIPSNLERSSMPSPQEVEAQYNENPEAFKKSQSRTPSITQQQSQPQSNSQSINKTSEESNPQSNSKSPIERYNIQNKKNAAEEILEKIRLQKEAADKEINETK